MDSRLILQNILRFLLLVLFQALILNNVHMGGFVVPFIYILFIAMLPVGMNRVGLLFLAFVTGLIMDVFCNMPGFHAFACTLIAFCRITFADRILTRNEAVEIPTPSIHSVKPQYFIGYLIVLTAIFIKIESGFSSASQLCS